MARLAYCIIAALMAASVLDAASIKWTGYAANGQWDTPNNWYPNTVPGPSDDVTINTGNVTITSPVTVSSISMGSKVGEYPFLIVDSTLLIENTFTVNVNGGIVLAAGASSITGTVTMGGTLEFSSGSVSGNWQIAKGATLNLGGASEKAFIAAQFAIDVDAPISGVVVLNQSSVVTATGTLTADGDFSIQAGDSTTVSFDTSKGTVTYNGNGVFQVQAPWSVGTFNFNAGNLTLFESVTFGAAFNVPSGSTFKTLGVASCSLPAGLTGSGYVHVEGQSFTVGGANFSGSINAQAGLFSSSAASFINTLMISGATVTVDKKLSVATAAMTAGQIQGTSSLEIADGTLMSAGFNINATTVFTKNFKATGSVISLGTKGKLHIASGATFTAASSTSVSGPTGTGGIENNGMIMASGSFSVTNIDIMGTGSVTVAEEFQVGTLTISQAVVALTGTGKFVGATTDISSIGKITGTPGVTGAIGAYSVTCPKECDNVSTSGIPTTTFIFSVSKSQ